MSNPRDLDRAFLLAAATQFGIVSSISPYQLVKDTLCTFMSILGIFRAERAYTRVLVPVRSQKWIPGSASLFMGGFEDCFLDAGPILRG